MAHMIDMTNARANMAFVGETPWHKLGTELTVGADLGVWAAAAGLTHDVKRAAVEFHTETQAQVYTDRHVLYRSDNGKPLGIVSHGYNIVQPREVLGFFDKLTRHNGFTMETAGSLDGGKRVWALAKAGNGVAVGDTDEVRPYVLLATSYDGSMATVAKLTTIRVVCHNTLTMSAGHAGAGQSESDTEASCIRVPHNQVFDADAARMDLGLAVTAFEKFMLDARKLAKKKITKGGAHEFLKELLPVPMKMVEVAGTSIKVPQPQPIEDSKAYKQILALFNGEGKGADLKESKGTAWGLLNAVTEHVDWQRGRSDNGRMSSAWFGAGDQMKSAARDLLLTIAA